MDQDERQYIDEAVARERSARIKAEDDLLAVHIRRLEDQISSVDRFYAQRFTDMEHSVKVALAAAKSGPPWQMVIGALLGIAVLIALLALVARGAI
jgi:hypothetical protein